MGSPPTTQEEEEEEEEDVATQERKTKTKERGRREGGRHLGLDACSLARFVLSPWRPSPGHSECNRAYPYPMYVLCLTWASLRDSPPPIHKCAQREKCAHVSAK